MTLSEATLWLAVFTAISSIATASMAWYTRTIIKNNDKIIKQNEQHHMDSSRPILAIVTDKNIEQYDERPIISTVEQGAGNEPIISNNFAKYNVNGTLRNIGVGPALNITLLIRFENSSRKEICFDFPPLESASQHPIGIIDFHTPSFDSDFLSDDDNRFKLSEYQSAPGQGWEIYISYADIYGNQFYTRHPKNPQERWTTLGGKDIPPGKSKEAVTKELELIRMICTTTTTGHSHD